MHPRSNQPGQFFATAKTHKFESVGYIIDQTGTYIYEASKVVAKYLGPLPEDDYTKRDTLSFLDLLKSAPSDYNCEGVSYDRESLFISIPVHKTIDYILYKF